MDSVAQVFMQWIYPFSERLVVYLMPADNERGLVGSYPGGHTGPAGPLSSVAPAEEDYSNAPP